MVPLLDVALAALPAGDDALRAMVMGRLAAALFDPRHHARRTELFAEASAMAERIGDERALASVILNKLLAHWGAVPLHELGARGHPGRRVLLRVRLETPGPPREDVLAPGRRRPALRGRGGVRAANAALARALALRPRSHARTPWGTRRSRARARRPSRRDRGSASLRLAESAGDFGFDKGEDVALRGFSGTHRVFGLVWDAGAAGALPRRVAAPPASAVERISPDNVFRREGDFWTIAYGGKSVRMKDAKGLQFLAVLLRRQGEEVHAIDLVDGRTVARVPAGVSSGTELEVAVGLGDAGEVLDPKARSECRERLESLRAELEEARANNDTGRVERATEEIDLLAGELSGAYGLGGRARQAAASTERARKAVSSRVTDSIARIRKEHPDLGAHLANSVRLGLFCRYEPERSVRWRL